MSNAMPPLSPTAETDFQALNAFAADNPELERLEDILAQFNIFEAIGVVHHELRHSDFLAFLLDPSRNHGLADAFLKKFLQEVSPDDCMEGSFEAVDVRREWSHIDILLLNERQRLVVLIENKIWAGLQSDQLKRYYDAVQSEWPGYKILALYLTPKGGEPNHPDYIAIDYGVVCRAVEAVSADLQGRPDPGVYLLLTHYAQMLRRHIMTDTEVADLCRSIYGKHRRALDLIFEHRRDIRGEIRDIGIRILSDGPDWSYDGQHGAAWANFLPVEWKSSRPLSTLFCQLRFDATELAFTINIWNANPFDERLQLWEMAKRFGWPVQQLRQGNNQTEIYRHKIFNVSQADLDEADMETSIQENWASFLDQQYQDIRTLLLGEDWLWNAGVPLPPQTVHQLGLGEVVKGLIVAANTLLKLYDVGKRYKYVTFGLNVWEESARYRHEQECKDGFWPLYFCVNNDKQGLRVCLFVGPGDHVVRERLLEMAKKNSFTGCPKRLKNWCPISTVPLLSAGEYGLPQEEADKLVSERWVAFLLDELPRTAQAIRDESWLWEMP